MTSSSLVRTPVVTRSRLHVAGSVEEDVSLLSVLQELRQLREEQTQREVEFSARLQQRDEELQNLREFIQISPSNNGSNNRIVNTDSGAYVPADDFRKELGYKLKPDTFNGEVPLREFFMQFDMIARANHWSEATKAVALASSLRGKARSVLECLQDSENVDFSELKAKLELRFGEGQSMQNYYFQFSNRRQKFGEDLAALGIEIERLSRMAYSELSYPIRDKIACAQFITALSDRFIKKTLQMEGITSLSLAVDRAKAIKDIQDRNYYNEKTDYFYEERFGKGRKFNSNKFGNKDSERGKVFKGKIKERHEENIQKFSRECWQCGKVGHFRSECPSLSREEKGN